MIENRDNAPLKCKAVKGLQLPQYLIAYLEQDKKYHLKFADSFATKPQYDLQYFVDTIQHMIETATIDKIEIIKNKTKPVVTTTNKKKNLIWITVVLAIVVLVFFTLKMMNELNKKNEHDSI